MDLEQQIKMAAYDVRVALKPFENLDPQTRQRAINEVLGSIFYQEPVVIDGPGLVREIDEPDQPSEINTPSES